MDMDELTRTMQDIHARGYTNVECDDCGRSHRVEPDARNYDCHNPDCDGTISSPLAEHGMI